MYLYMYNKNKNNIFFIISISIIIIIWLLFILYKTTNYMSENIILLNISNKSLLTYILSLLTYILFGEYPYIYRGNKSFDNKEGIKIMPHYLVLKIIMNYLFTPLKPALHNLDKNVCFLDIDDKYDNIRISCDWCSICNGITETAKQNIIKNPTLLKQIDFEGLKICDKYLDFVLVDRKEKLSKKHIKKWCENTFGKITLDLLLLSQIYLKIEMIELRWCPFKRSKEFYYRNKDKRYLEPTEKMIYQVGKILSKYETITCNNCSIVVNDNWKYTKSNTQSIFKPLLDYMMKEINSK